MALPLLQLRLHLLHPPSHPLDPLRPRSNPLRRLRRGHRLLRRLHPLPLRHGTLIPPPRPSHRFRLFILPHRARHPLRRLRLLPGLLPRGPAPRRPLPRQLRRESVLDDIHLFSLRRRPRQRRLRRLGQHRRRRRPIPHAPNPLPPPLPETLLLLRVAAILLNPRNLPTRHGGARPCLRPRP
ncbi:unnamed protein product [Linum tenue]|uniref:Uncharacterized protein n=1 Tax=Linum tenue TaxID=586396 RepID=A0AAV0N9Y0_9ROSI|nr:unnamed protein product [Linum tenue]